MRGPSTKRRSRAGYKLDQQTPDGKFKKVGDYREGQVLQLTTTEDATYRLRDSGLNFTLFDLRVGETALVKGLSYRVLPAQEEAQSNAA